MKNVKKGLLHLFIVFAIIAFFAVTVFIGLGNQHKGSAKNILLGLDLAGGVSITYETVGDFNQKQMSDTVYKLQKRAESYNTESQVYQEGENRINVDIPGAKNQREALDRMGQAGSMYFISQAAYQQAITDYPYTTNEKGQIVFDDGVEFSEVICDGSDIDDAQPQAVKDDKTGITKNVVMLSFTGKGANKFADASTAAYNNGNEPIHIVYDNIVISSPSVNSPILDGNCEISGGFETIDDANDLATTIRIGALPIELKVLRYNTVGAKLGAEAIETSLIAALIGFVLLVLFMIIYYRLPGFSAVLALTFYIGAVMLAINWLNVTLTLPGIAGVILSIGMAVDANVIIFTRIREEIASGKTVKSAIKIGFEKATSAIVDGNVTTLIAAAVLWFLGSGTVKGFAQTLAIGIVLSMFTALYVTKVILNAFYNFGLSAEKYYGVMKEVKVIDFVKNKAKYFVISALLFAICIGGLVFNYVTSGSILNYSLDFVGGSSTQITFDEATKVTPEIKADIDKIFKDTTPSAGIPEIADVEGVNAILVKTKELSVDENNALIEALVSSSYGIKEENIQTETISATVSGEMKSDAIVAVIIAAICMLIYIWIRFKNLAFGAASVLALIHDIIVVLMVYAVFKNWISVGNTFIACMLTIVGYSINATIVVFDRIRENAQTRGKDKLAEVVNLSVSQTISRSINTSLTTAFMVIMLVILGVDSVRQFAIPLLAGIVCGCYSSICIAGTLYYVFKSSALKKSAK